MRRLILALLLMQVATPAAIRDIVARLRHVPADGGAVPPQASADLTALKHSLRDLISQTVGASGAIEAVPEELQARVIEQLEREDVPVGDEGEFGVITAIKLSQPREYPGWLAASVSLGIPYGDDTSLYVFQIRGDSWQLALTVETNGYDSIDGAQGWLQYRVACWSGKPFLITTDHNPWPSSNLQGLRLKVLRVGPQPDHPIRLVSRSFTYYVGSEQVSIRDGGVGLIYKGVSLKYRMGDLRSVRYVEYAVKAGAASVVTETAIDPSLFTYRWARTDWQTASAAVDPPARGEAREWYRRLRKWRFGCSDGPQLARQVTEGRERLLAGVGCSGPVDGDSPVGYAVLRPGPRGFRIVSISSSRPEWFGVYTRPSCTPAPSGQTHPTAEQTVQPELPNGIASGTVRLRVTIDAEGSVYAAEVLDWPDQPGLVVPAIRAARQWKFKPATRDGCIVPDDQTIDIIFTPPH
jgi:TonB family protein